VPVTLHRSPRDATALSPSSLSRNEFHAAQGDELRLVGPVPETGRLCKMLSRPAKRDSGIREGLHCSSRLFPGTPDRLGKCSFVDPAVIRNEHG